jgi:TRAP-type mannitol/chloroaromatic compound transport system substrate-binding protein
MCFAKKVSDLTGGKFQITTHAAGELMPAFGVLDGVSNGTVEMANTAPYYFFGKDPTYALDCAIPFGLNSRQMTAWMFEGNGLKLTREFYAKVGIVNFPMGNTGAQMGWLVPQGNQIVGRPQGPQVPCRWLWRQSGRAHRRGAAEHPWRRNLPGA